MKITVKTTYDITYQVEYSEPTEGGADCDFFGDRVETIEEAISILQIAEVTKPSRDWYVHCDVSKKVDNA